jgi:hypothetical protein
MLQGEITVALSALLNPAKPRCFVLTVSEVTNSGKGNFGSGPVRFLALGFLFLFGAMPVALVDTADAADTAPMPLSRDLARDLGDCNWQVTYRGRQYDLSPLTREALSRPIENDIRFAIQRVPEANARLDTMTSLLREARAHTIIATAFLGAFALLKVLESNQDNKSRREDYQTASLASAGFFLGATYFSWKTTRDAKQELVHAVADFNAKSPHKIVPANQGIEAPK